MKSDFNATYQQAKAQLAAKMLQHAQLEQEIAQLRQFIGSMEITFANSIEAERQQEIGLQDACRQVLMASGKSMTVSDVIKFLPFTGLDLSAYVSITAPVTTTLKRLVKGGTVDSHEVNGRVTYQWRTLEQMKKQLSEIEAAYKKAQQMEKKHRKP